ncbi:hypothetical protein HHL11_06555 [Ramlibacter sp. G-1-2-2]|uniref:Flagellar hook-length control protein-like C-terminal domain-containing protein n=1 Tax=Ramlibacter agri TaxID=2728837 RepID=A0A848GXM3_9BURK|nr:flagellar hook-length control protein FliK [Ramlibacter agri]NML43406.1 hypothetical protein [Ramlibacter agri]
MKAAAPHVQAPRAAAAHGAQAASAKPASGDAASDAFAALLDGLCPDDAVPVTAADAKALPADEPGAQKKPAAKAAEAVPDAFLAALPQQQQPIPATQLTVLPDAKAQAQLPDQQITGADAKGRPATPDLQLAATPEPAHHVATGAFQALLAAVPGGSPAKQEHAAAETPSLQAADLSALAAASSQPQQLAPAVPATAVHQAALPSHPLDAAFAGDLGVEVRWMVESGLQQAELHLHPADLGPIHIQLSVQQQAAEISLSAAHATTREGLQQALPALREMLAGQGLQLAQAGVSSGQQQRQQAREQPPAREKNTQLPGVGAISAAPRRSGGARTQGTLGLLDLYA